MENITSVPKYGDTHCKQNDDKLECGNYHGIKQLFTCDLPVRPSFRLSDGHGGQEVVSNF